MNLQVKNRQSILHTILEKEPFIIISIAEDGDFPFIPKNSQCLDILRVSFYDLDEPVAACPECNLINDEQAQEIVDFVIKYKEQVETIVCQCDAGISRSSAVAAALSKFFNGEDEYYFKKYIPNRLVYRKMLEKLS